MKFSKEISLLLGFGLNAGFVVGKLMLDVYSLGCCCCCGSLDLLRGSNA